MRTLLIFSLFCTALNVSATDNDGVLTQCIQEMMVNSASMVTVGEIKQACYERTGLDTNIEADVFNDAKEQTQLERRLESEKLAFDNEFLIATHKPNYILLFAKNAQTNEAPFALQFPDEDTSLDDTEVKFQISAKFPLARNVFGKGVVYFAYTNRSFWQLYNENSAPFRETNHEPEIFLTLPTAWELSGFKFSFINLGFVHQSNGRAGTLSRSWNRIYANFIIEKGNGLLSFKPWYRIEEDEADDNNPDIEDYMGHFELSGLYNLRRHSLGFMLRNNLKSDNRGAIQIDWMFPLTSVFHGYVQYFNGYGESLIDYNYDQESIGIGLALTGWL